MIMKMAIIEIADNPVTIRPLLLAIVFITSFVGCTIDDWEATTATNGRLSQQEVVSALKNTTFGNPNGHHDVLVFPPYTPDSVISQELNRYDGAASVRSSVSSSDGVNLVVLINSREKSIRGWSDLARGDFDWDFNGASVLKGKLINPK